MSKSGYKGPAQGVPRLDKAFRSFLSRFRSCWPLLSGHQIGGEGSMNTAKCPVGVGSDNWPLAPLPEEVSSSNCFLPEAVRGGKQDDRQESTLTEAGGSL